MVGGVRVCVNSSEDVSVQSVVNSTVIIRPASLAERTMDYRKIITVEPGKRSGQPCIRGLRMTVYDVLDYLASGMSYEDVLEDFPDLTREDILACLAFAADRERRSAYIPPL